MDWMWNRYSISRRSARARIESRFEWSITFDSTVESRSKFYRSFRRPFFFCSKKTALFRGVVV
jgi:hypothetical protein